jgi:aldehyde dehydrogenase (NAD+)
VNVVPGGRATGEALVRHPGVDKITFAGSTVAGRRIGAIAVENLTRMSIALGGKSAGIVLEDAVLEDTIPVLALGNFGNSGQECTALSRVLVPRARHDEYVAGLAEVASREVVGDPFEPETTMGPLPAGATVIGWRPRSSARSPTARPSLRAAAGPRA